MSQINKSYYGYALELAKDDKRLKRYAAQREDFGFDDTETWNLNITLCRFISPRLKRLLEIQIKNIKPPYGEYFSDLKILSKAMDSYIEDSWDDKSTETIKELLPKVFIYLWV